MNYGKSIELFLVDGTADGVVTAELSNWNGKAIKIPRQLVAKSERIDIRDAGVYFLFTKTDDDADAVYIGEAENVYDRLVQHIRDFQSGKEQFEWNQALIFIGRDLNKASIRYLENALVELSRNARRYVILTKNTYKNTKMKESQIAVMEEFIDNVKILINALGYKVLEPLIDVDDKTESTSPTFSISTSTIIATGKTTNEGFVLLRGSQISENASPSLSQGYKQQRAKLLSSGKIQEYTLVEDILFSSSTAAAAFVMGCPTSGPQRWKDASGKTLKEHETI